MNWVKIKIESLNAAMLLLLISGLGWALWRYYEIVAIMLVFFLAKKCSDWAAQIAKKELERLKKELERVKQK